MSFRRIRPSLQGAVLAVLALVFPGEFSLAQAPEPAAHESASGSGSLRSPRKTGTVSYVGVPPVPPVPGQVVSAPSSKGGLERPKRVPPILVAFVLLFLITWVRAHVERRRLRARFRQSCESPTQSESPPQPYI